MTGGLIETLDAVSLCSSSILGIFCLNSDIIEEYRAADSLLVSEDFESWEISGFETCGRTGCSGFLIGSVASHQAPGIVGVSVSCTSSSSDGQASHVRSEMLAECFRGTSGFSNSRSSKSSHAGDSIDEYRGGFPEASAGDTCGERSDADFEGSFGGTSGGSSTSSIHGSKLTFDVVEDLTVDALERFCPCESEALEISSSSTSLISLIGSSIVLGFLALGGRNLATTALATWAST